MCVCVWKKKREKNRNNSNNNTQQHPDPDHATGKRINNFPSTFWQEITVLESNISCVESFFVIFVFNLVRCNYNTPSAYFDSSYGGGHFPAQQNGILLYGVLDSEKGPRHHPSSRQDRCLLALQSVQQQQQQVIKSTATTI